MPVRADRDRPLQWFFDDVPRQDLYDAMLLSGDDRFRRLHSALHDDAYRKTSFGTLCRRFGLSWSDCMNLWWEHNRYWGLLALANRLQKCEGGDRVRVPGDEHARRLVFRVIGPT